MSNNKTTPDAFAFACVDSNSHLQEGLTKREYFASMAMQGICTNQNYNPTQEFHFANAALDAVKQADALIKVLNNEQQ